MSTLPMQHVETETDNALSLVLIQLMKGVVFREDHQKLWHHLLSLQTQVRDYVGMLGLSLSLHEDEGFAWLQTQSNEEQETLDKTPLPKLVIKRQLSYPVSLLLALLRKKLAENDSESSDSRLILEREELVEMMRTFLPDSFNDARIVDQIDSYINKVIELGFARRLKKDKHKIEIRRIIVAFVNAQWLTEFDQRLVEYMDYLKEGNDESRILR